MKNAAITGTQIETGTTHVANSNEKGEFQFDGLPPGKYTLKVSHQEYSDLDRIDFWVTRENLTRLPTVLLFLTPISEKRALRNHLPVRNPTQTWAQLRPGSIGNYANRPTPQNLRPHAALP
jgi:Carboxypeptidase regulatory-like domain